MAGGSVGREIFEARKEPTNGPLRGIFCLLMACLPCDKNSHDPVIPVIDDAVVEAGKDAGEDGGKRCIMECCRDGCFFHLLFTLNPETLFFL